MLSLPPVFLRLLARLVVHDVVFPTAEGVSLTSGTGHAALLSLVLAAIDPREHPETFLLA